MHCTYTHTQWGDFGAVPHCARIGEAHSRVDEVEGRDGGVVGHLLPDILDVSPGAAWVVQLHVQLLSQHGVVGLVPLGAFHLGVGVGVGVDLSAGC